MNGVDQIGGVLGEARSPKPCSESSILSPPAKPSMLVGTNARFVSET